jgi:hypothetical protein
LANARAADATVAASNDPRIVLQFAAAAMRFVLSAWPRLHLMFAARLPSLVLRRLKLLLLGHATSARRKFHRHLHAAASACALLSSRRPNITKRRELPPAALLFQRVTLAILLSALLSRGRSVCSVGLDYAVRP